MTTIITLDAVEKRSFTHPVVYKGSDLTLDVGDTLIARNEDTIIARNGDTIMTHRVATLGKRQIKQAEKRNFKMPVVVIDG